jgi:diaminopimelate epimerase
MIKLKTELISGAGNTFHIAYKQSEEFLHLANPHAAMQSAAKQICQKYKADGFILLEQSSANEFQWNFFNNDGSDAEMCGNATRCVGYFIANNLHQTNSPWLLTTVAGKIQITSQGAKQFQVKMSPIQKLNSSLGFFCDTGVPHLVLEFSKKDLFLNLNADLKSKSSQLRFHPEHQPRGTNVTYVELSEDPKKLKAVSFERGVEDFTAACGTGAMAAAYFNLAKRGISETEVEMPGGTLIMNLSNLESPLMTGPAVKLGSFEYEFEI